jgi:Skp family chaperone for outer membrane proteins
MMRWILIVVTALALMLSACGKIGSGERVAVVNWDKALQERLGNKEKDLMDPLLNEINEVIKKIAEKKGLKVVVDKSTVVYGGTDITDEVAKALQNPKK